jgi:cysteine-S-conjugate beta-lyase
MTDKKRSPATQQIHHPYVPPSTYEAVVSAVHKGSTVLFPNVAALRSRSWLDKSAYTYGLHGTPTSFTLEERLATLEGGTHALLAPSGLSAIALVNAALLKTGDHVLLPDNAYNPGKELARHELARWGITHGFYDAMNADSLSAALTPATKLVWLEAPGSVTLEFPDLRALVRTAREQAPHAVLALDNTWGAGLAFAPFDLGEGLSVDLTIHALTKYPSGGADVLMGSVVTRDDALYKQLAMAHSRLGMGVGMNDVELVLRSLPTLALRYAAQDAAARRFAAWCGSRREFARVLHPATPGSPGHAHWAALCSAAAGLVTVEVDPAFSAVQVDAFVDALALFGIGWSWGGPMSLAVPYNVRAIRTQPVAYQGTLVRFCIGLEDVDDLIADAQRAVEAVLKR